MRTFAVILAVALLALMLPAGLRAIDAWEEERWSRFLWEGLRFLIVLAAAVLLLIVGWRP